MKSLFLKILVLLLISHSANGQWSQLGTEIIGETESGNAGFAVHINADGTVIAVGDQGAILDDIDSRGEVRVYMLLDGAWVAKGAPIQGVGEYEWCGQEVALDSTGDVLAVSSINTFNSNENSVGSVRVYEWDGTAWQIRGDVLEGQDNPLGFVTFYGYGVDLSADGNTVLITGPEKWSADWTTQKVGYAEVFDWNGSTWIQRGESVFGTVSFMELGFSCALSADGETMVLGGNGFDGSAETGMARVYVWDEVSWIQKGEDLLGVLPQDELGRSVSIANEGNTIAVGAPGYSIPTNLQGEVMVYDWDGSAWVQRGATLSSLEDIDYFGADVSLSADGMRLAVTASNLTNNALVVGNAGGALIFDWNGSEWELVLGPVFGEQSMEYAREIELSSDGNTFILGSFGFAPAGRTRVFTEEQPSALSSVKRLDLNMYPNPATESLNVFWPGEKQGPAIYHLIDTQGRILRNGRISSGTHLSLVGLSAGLYRLRLMFEDGRWTEQGFCVQR